VGFIMSEWALSVDLLEQVAALVECFFFCFLVAIHAYMHSKVSYSLCALCVTKFCLGSIGLS